MRIRQNYLALLVLLILVICRVGAVAHAVEHSFEGETEHCEVCSLIDNNSHGLVTVFQSAIENEPTQLSCPYHSPQFSVNSVWDSLSRAPPVIS